MLKSVIFPKASMVLCGKFIDKYKPICYYAITEELLKAAPMEPTMEIELSITGLDRKQIKPITIQEFRILIENYAMDTFTKIDWSKMEYKKISLECLTTILANNKIIIEYLQNEKFKNEKIYFYTFDEYHIFLEKLLEFLNETIPLLLSLDIYKKC